MKVPAQMFRLLLAFLVVLGSSASVLAREVHVGKIVFAADGKLMISDQDDTNEVFVVAEDAKITRNGKAARLTDLAQGDAVTVTAHRKEGKLVATEIAATTGK